MFVGLTRVRLSTFLEEEKSANLSRNAMCWMSARSNLTARQLVLCDDTELLNWPRKCSLALSTKRLGKCGRYMHLNVIFCTFLGISTKSVSQMHQHLQVVGFQPRGWSYWPIRGEQMATSTPSLGGSLTAALCIQHHRRHLPTIPTTVLIFAA